MEQRTRPGTHTYSVWRSDPSRDITRYPGLGLRLLLVALLAAGAEPEVAQARSAHDVRSVGAVEMPERADSGSVPSQATITVEDVVREVVIGDPFTTSWGDWARREHVSVTSDDGRYTAVVTVWGDVERGVNVGALLGYRTAELLLSPTPRKVIELASQTNRQPLAFVRWLSDNRTLVFAGTDGARPTQVYRVDVETLKLDRMTEEVTPVEWYDITSDGRHLVVAVKPPAVRPDEDPSCIRQGCLVTSRTLWDAQSGEDEGSALMNAYDLTTGERSTPARPESLDADIDRCEDEIKGGLSPDGRFGVRSCVLKVGHWPSWWADYRADPELAKYLARSNAYYAHRLVLTDFQTGESKTLTEAPYVWLHQPDPIWIDGGRGLLIAGALQPLAGISPDEYRQRSARKMVLLFDPITGRSERIGVLPVEAVSVTRGNWNQDAETLTLEIADAAGEALEGVAYRRTGEAWVAADPEGNGSAGANHSSPHLVIRESLNSPPVLKAVDPETGMENLVLDPNPWLADRQIGRVEEISWTVREGLKWRGGLYYPPEYDPGVRYPLVILTHGFHDDRFSLSGYSRNFAAQPLAGLGMMVLQVEERLRDVVSTPDEWPTVQAGYEVAIDHLDERGLIDRQRVGIQGWSRTGPHVGYTLTHSAYPIAAAAFTSTADFGWWYYLAAGTHPELEANYGAAPFGGGLDAWRNFSPSFNLDRVHAPILMWSDLNVAGQWDWYAGLKRLDKPVEYWFLPEGAHDVFKVGERVLTTQLLVDWFRFWLKNEEDPDPAKADQYRRWHELRRQHDSGLKQPPPAETRGTS